MKILKAISMITMLVVCVMAQTETTVETTQLSDNIYHFKVTTFYPVSTLASIGPDGILLVDPGMEQSTDGFMKALASISDQDVKIIINTHSHDHHTAMNKSLGKTAEIYAHKESLGLMKGDLDVLVEWTDEAFPTHSIDQETSLTFNGEEIKLIPVPGGHCKDDLMVYFTKSKVACTGGVLKSGSYPLIDYARGGSYKNFPTLARQALNSFPEDVVFVQSHGDNFKYRNGLDYVQRVEKSIAIIQKEFEAGKTAENMIEDNVLNAIASGDRVYPNRNFWIRNVLNGLDSKNNPLKKSLTAPLYRALQDGSGEDAVNVYKQLQRDSKDEYGFNENVLNILGYYLIGKDRLDDAIAIFKLNMKEYPGSFNVYDSLGEAYMNRGNLWRAKYYYKKSIRINPQNQNGIDMLEKMRQNS